MNARRLIQFTSETVVDSNALGDAAIFRSTGLSDAEETGGHRHLWHTAVIRWPSAVKNAGLFCKKTPESVGPDKCRCLNWVSATDM
jgi:hypothetical protein